MPGSMSRHELVELVKRIVNEGPSVGKQCDEWVWQLKQNVPDPKVSDYIFWPDREMTPEEIVDRALSHEPPLLPG